VDIAHKPISQSAGEPKDDLVQGAFAGTESAPPSNVSLRGDAVLERERFKELLTQVPAAIGVLNGPDHRWAYVNDEYVRLTGRHSPADFVGKSFVESLPEIETQLFVKLMDEVYQSGQAFVGREMKALLNRSSVGLPEESYWDFVYQPVRDSGGNVEGILLHAIEVTERVQAKRAIESSERKFRDLAETTSIALHWVGPDGTILWANRAELELLGYEAEEYIGQNIAKFHIDSPVLDCILARLSRGEKLRDQCARLRAKDGSTRYVVIDSSVLFEEGKFVHTWCFTRDITDQRIAENALRESEQQLRVITEATPVMVWLSGTDKLCYYFNKSWLNFVGRTLQEEIGNGWAENVHPDDLDRCLKIYMTSFDERRPFKMEYRLRHRSGAYRWIFDHGMPRFSPDGTFEGYVGGCLDIHDQKEAAEKVRSANEALRRNKELLEIALAASDTGTFSWNPDTDSIAIDDNLKRLIGMEPQENLASLDDFVRRVQEDDRVRLIFAIDACRAGGDFNTEFRIPTSAGGFRWLHGRAKLQYEDGKPAFFVGACTDITSRKNAEELLRQSELWLAGQKQAFRAAIDGAPLSESLELLIRTAIKQFHGRARCAFFISDETGTELQHVVGMPEDYARCVKGFKTGPEPLACGMAANTGVPRIIPDVREDPLWKPWLWLAEKYDYRGCWSFPVKTSTGKSIGTFEMYFQDPRQPTSRDYQLANALTNAAAIIISRHQEAEERERAEGVLRENEQLLLLAQGAAQVGAWEWDPAHDSRRLSPELHRLFGTEAEDPEYDQRWAKCVYPEDWNKVQQHMEEGSRSGEIDFEYRYQHPDQGLRWFYCKGRRFKNETRMFGTVQDITERKRAEEALAESEEKYRIVAETASDVIVSIDETSTILFANSATEQVFGYTPDELVGKNLTMLMPGYMRHLHEAGLERYVASGQRHLNWHGTELPGLHRDGREIPLEVSFGEYSKAGKRYFTGLARDITRRKLAGHALKESEERFRALVSASSYVVYRMSPDWSEMRQLDGRGFISDTREPTKNWIEIYIDSDDQPLVLQTIKRAIETKSVFQLEHRVRRVDGTLGWTLSRAVPVIDKNGNIVEWFGAASDITARKRDEEARRRLAAIVESSEDAIIGKDLNGIVTSWNRKAELLFGYTEEEIVGRSVLAIIPPEMQGDEEMILNKIRSGQKIDHFETIRMSKSGERIEVSLSISPIRDEHGNIVGAAKIARDIRESKKIERTLRTTEKSAAAGRLAAAMAHEIRNPIAAVTNLVYLARSTNDSAQIDSLLAQMDEELSRIAVLSKQTLGFYRDKGGTKPLKIRNVVESLIAAFASKSRKKSIDLKLEIRQEPEISAIEGEIRQVVANLLSNSIDATSAGGTIRVRISAGRAWDETLVRGVRLTIADSGRGIAPEDRPKVFEPFFTTNKDLGNGLGLWIAKEIIERHGGTLRFKSQARPGKSGTAFTVFLPSDSKERAIKLG